MKYKRHFHKWERNYINEEERNNSVMSKRECAICGKTQVRFYLDILWSTIKRGEYDKEKKT